MWRVALKPAGRAQRTSPRVGWVLRLAQASFRQHRATVSLVALDACQAVAVVWRQKLGGLRASAHDRERRCGLRDGAQWRLRWRLNAVERAP